MSRKRRLVLVVEDLRARNTWLEMVGLARRCCCPRQSLPELDVRTTAGPLEGYRVCNILRAQLVKGGVHAVLVLDTDRYGGDPARAVEAVKKALSTCGKLPSYTVMPVVEKLEDWVVALLESRPCRCCGIDRLSSLLGEKYEKHMMASRVPRMLRESHAPCDALASRSLTRAMGLNKLLEIACQGQSGC